MLVACIDLYVLTPLLSSSSVNNNTSTLRLLRIIKLVGSSALHVNLLICLVSRFEQSELCEHFACSEDLGSRETPIALSGLRLLIQACSSFLPSLGRLV